VALGWHGVCLSTGNKAIATASKQINKNLVKRGGLKSLSGGQFYCPSVFLLGGKIIRSQKVPVTYFTLVTKISRGFFDMIKRVLKMPQ
jgi:hypothetical protein